jgi:Na+/serine symporter
MKNQSVCDSNWKYRFRVFNALKPMLVFIIVINSVRTLKRTQHFTITKINWLVLFKEIIAVYNENINL